MFNKYRYNRKKIIKYFIYFVIILNSLVPLYLISLQTNSNLNYNEYYSSNIIPKQQSLSKENFSPILNKEEQSLGNVSIVNMTFNGLEKGYDYIGGYKEEYNDLADDITFGGLNISYKSMKYIETVKYARYMNLPENSTERNTITVKLNETLSVQYNMSTDTGVGEEMGGFLIYGPRLFPCRLINLSVKENGTNIVKNVNEGNFSIDDGIKFLKFNYDNFFKGVEVKNFSMYIIWQYNLTVSDWELSQYKDKNYELVVRKREQTVTPEFNYNLKIVGLRFNGTIKGPTSYPFTEYQIKAAEVEANITIELPDKNLLKNHELLINDQNINNFIFSENIVKTGYISVNLSHINLNFTADFKVKFIKAVENTWAIDRLVKNRNIRERIYYPSIISGPQYIYVKYITFYETTISADQVKSNTSLFERAINYYDANISEYEEETRDSLVFTENATKKKGLEVKLPYLIRGETCPFIFKYKTTQDLRVIITDNINMPLVGLNVEIYYYGAKYGTYISKDISQPIAPTITNENGEIFIRNVPNGNYTLKIFHDTQLILETSVSAYADINYIMTNQPHFPLWMILFGIFNGTILLIGLIFYLKNKKK